MSDSPKPGGAIWKTGIHHVSLGGQPIRLAAPQYSLIQNYQLMKRKIRENGHIPIGIDHIPSEVMASNPVLRKLLETHEINPYDVGQIHDVTTDGESIRITDAEFTNPTIQNLFTNGELTAWSVVEDIKAHPCPTEKADAVADYFNDIERVDLVGRGGCDSCLVEDGGIPNGYERINAHFMEVETLTEEEYRNNENEESEEEEEQTNQEEESGGEEEEMEESNENSLILGIQNQISQLTDTVGTLTQTVTGIVDGTIEAKLPEKYQKQFEEVDKLKLEASKAKIVALVDGKIQAGYVTPAMKDGLLKAGLAMEDEDFTELLAGYKDKLWDPTTYNGGSPKDEESGNDTLNLSAMRESRQQYKY